MKRMLIALWCFFAAGAAVAQPSPQSGVVLGATPGCVAGISCFASQLFLGGYTPDSNALGVLGTSMFTGIATDQGATTTSPGWYAQLTGDTVARVRIGLNSTDGASLGMGPGGSAARDTFLERAGASTFRFGGAPSATPVAQTLLFQPVVTGTSNAAGANAIIQLSSGTGTGISGNLTIQGAPAGASGNTPNPFTNSFVFNGNTGNFTGTSANIGSLTVNSATSAGGITAAGFQTTAVTGFYDWAASTVLKAPSDGTLQITNNTATNSINLTVGASNLLTLNGGLTTGGPLTIAGDSKSTGTIPTVTGTGTPTITVGSTDTAGEVTSGASAISVVITFAVAKTNAPFCTVTPQTQLAAFAYTISTTAITITQTLTSGEKIDYHCFQH